MGIFDRSQQTSLTDSPPFFGVPVWLVALCVGKSNVVIGVIQIDLFVVLDKGRDHVIQHFSGLHELLLRPYFSPPPLKRKEERKLQKR
jgi:hypothetical protein